MLRKRNASVYVEGWLNHVGAAPKQWCTKSEQDLVRGFAELTNSNSSSLLCRDESFKEEDWHKVGVHAAAGFSRKDGNTAARARLKMRILERMGEAPVQKLVEIAAEVNNGFMRLHPHVATYLCDLMSLLPEVGFEAGDASFAAWNRFWKGDKEQEVKLLLYVAACLNTFEWDDELFCAVDEALAMHEMYQVAEVSGASEEDGASSAKPCDLSEDWEPLVLATNPLPPRQLVKGLRRLDGWPDGATIEQLVELYNAQSKSRFAESLSDVESIYSVSDLHVNFAENKQWLQTLPVYGPHALLIVAGDIAETLDLLKKTFVKLKACFGHVAYCPGNHEMWLTRKDPKTSVEKFFQVLELCDLLGIYTTPVFVRKDLVIVPLFSWFDAGFCEDSEGYIKQAVTNLDGFEKNTRWPSFLLPYEFNRAFFFENAGFVTASPQFSPRIDDFFTSLNTAALEFQYGNANIISFSHFLPQQKLHKGPWLLGSIMGSRALGNQVNTMAPHVHVFGHSHVKIDTVIQGTRFIQNPLAYPKERGDKRYEPTCIWSVEGEFRPNKVSKAVSFGLWNRQKSFDRLELESTAQQVQSLASRHNMWVRVPGLDMNSKELRTLLEAWRQASGESSGDASWFPFDVFGLFRPANRESGPAPKTPRKLRRESWDVFGIFDPNTDRPPVVVVPHELPSTVTGHIRWAIDLESWEPAGAADGPEFEHYLSLLGDEQDKNRIRSRKIWKSKRASFVGCLAARRACSAAIGSSSLNHLKIQRTRGGKPFLCEPLPDDALNFNYSIARCRKMVVVATDPTFLCGVDIVVPWKLLEDHHVRKLEAEIQDAEAYFTEAELEWAKIAMLSIEEHYERLAMLWACKEAVAKARGDGFALDFKRLEVRLQKREGWKDRTGKTAVLSIDDVPREDWQIDLESVNGHWVAVARGPPSDVCDADGEFSKTLRLPPNSPVWVTASSAQVPAFTVLPVSALVPVELRYPASVAEPSSSSVEQPHEESMDQEGCQQTDYAF